MAVKETVPGSEPELEKTGGEIAAARGRAEATSSDDFGHMQYEEGFTWKVVFGGLFVALVMLPGSIYIGLIMGQSLGGAAEWVTIVLFSEIARRSFIPLKRQELYCLFYMVSALTATGIGGLPGIAGGPFGNLIAIQYIIQSPAMAPVAHILTQSHWIAPALGSSAYHNRSLADPAWLLPIGLILCGQVLDRMQWMGLGYVLFRITSDVEQLPFPMAAVAASGATALAEANSKTESWRWRVFSVGTIVGLVWGVFFLGVPIITGILFTKPVMIFPIPFFDLTPNTEHILPTALIGYNPDIGAILVGFILPFQIVLGSFISSVVCQIGLNPILYYHHMFPDWVPSSPAIQTNISIGFDFWMSFGIGTQLAIAVIGLSAVIRTLFFVKRTGAMARGSLFHVNKKRGDFPWSVALGAWFTATLGYIMLDHKLVPLFPVELICLYGLVITPLNSYVSARMIGLTGQGVSFPFLLQATVLKSGYQQPNIWFAPLPLGDYGGQAQKFREIELTGTKFTSILKLELFMMPLLLVASFAYWSFIWHTTDIPSAQFPYAQKMWPIFAVQRAIWTQINMHGGATWVLNAIKPKLIGTGAAVGLAIYLCCTAAKLPLLFFYGFIGGMQSMPHYTIPTFVGALLGRFYFAKRFGVHQWTMYAPVLLAGFACGSGLIGMSSIALALIGKTINYLPF